ncbi:unnamed protein product [Oppiella nova]|uniref:PIK3AP1 Toll/interleukin-1 receptor domain-containing protein n=1 Tax=Oppiella nova TaxID=334625 RepID=A0A7R9QVZ9_9ACAR|nr:unnamed protein product [Oppiella nova]CAG2177657.1 unnamed protein product [Oppiella nova]
MLSFIVPEIIVLFAADGHKWDRYLSEEFAQMIEFPLNIHHKHVEHMDEDFEEFLQSMPKFNAFILLLSRDFLNTMYVLSEKMYSLTKCMNPSKCLLMFCNCLESDVNDIHKSLLYGYRRCHRVVATHNDVKQFMINTVKCLSNILEFHKYKDNRMLKVSTKKYNNFISIAPQFELSTDIIYETKDRIYILLDSAISETQRIHVSIGVTNDILIVHYKNPFTLYFTIPVPWHS